jgi:hypothetical protein
MITTSQIQLISAVLPVPHGRAEDSKEKENRNIEGQKGKGQSTSAANGSTENAGKPSSGVIVVAKSAKRVF